ncbi:pex2 / pex12 amino terminal region domain-containing protein [Sarocladium implicatum]|nr:pex2 / pex12 amino terminal region domain-containing protein [Sarocladium implicatum]
MSTSQSPYPFASAPDIIRAHQKDAYFTGHLTNSLSDLHRRLLGARATHALGPELRASASLLYLALTTLPGNRTLGEEYCDLVQVHAGKGKGAGRGILPDLRRRALYILGSVVLPYLASRVLPSLRTRIRSLLNKRLETLRESSKSDSRESKLWTYLLQHLPSITSSAPIHAVTLALFYFSGTYYELTKRLLSLRYVFTRTVPDTPDRAGYEVLGVLLVIQLAVQGYLHVRSTLSEVSASAQQQRERLSGPDVSVSLDHNAYSANSDLLLGSQSPVATSTSKVDISATTHTPVLGRPRFDLEDDKVMGFIKGKQQRKCTLCLEELKDPAATQCGHVFCWECIGDWVREKPECPLCRREAMVQHILPLRVV